MIDKFCKFCGVEHNSRANPQTCANGHQTFRNPTPVAVILQPVVDDTIRLMPRYGILIGERGIEPQKGTFGLPGGFVDPEDADYEDAALRELREETGINLTREVADPSLFYSMSDGRCILVFVISDHVLPLSTLQSRFVANHECPAIDVAWEPMELSFQSHTDALRRWFEEDRLE